MTESIAQTPRHATWLKWGHTLFGESITEKLYAYLLAGEAQTQNPYHNLEHLLAVANRSMSIYMSMFTGWDTCAKEIQATWLAASLHDYGHSGGKLPDTQNILVAAHGAHEFIYSLPDREFASLHGLISQVHRLIEVTEYPFVKTPQTLAECVIRDADLLTTMEPDARVFLRGLLVELKRPPIEDDLELFNTNLEWIKAQRFYTTYGRDAIDELVRLFAEPNPHRA